MMTIKLKRWTVDTATNATQDEDKNSIPDVCVKKSQITSDPDDITAGSLAIATEALYFVCERGMP